MFHTKSSPTFVNVERYCNSFWLKATSDPFLSILTANANLTTSSCQQQTYVFCGNTRSSALAVSQSHLSVSVTYRFCSFYLCLSSRSMNSFLLNLSAIEWRLIAIEAVAVGTVIFFSVAPIFWRLLFRKFEGNHTHITSDIPGNPHVFDFGIISAMRTLPEPNNFNLVWTRVPLSEDLIVRGQLPPSRMSSLSVYGEGGTVPESKELPQQFKQQYRPQTLCAKLTKTTSNDDDKDSKYNAIINTKDWQHGMVVIRNYVVPPGTAVYTPEIVRVRDNKIIRCSEKLVAGAPNLHLAQSWFYDSVKVSVPIISAVLVNTFFFSSLVEHIKWQIINPLVAILALFVTRIIYASVYFIGRLRIRRTYTEHCPQPNEIFEVDMENSAKNSQPSKLHKYFVMRYEVPLGQELSIQAKIKHAGQKYWSLVVYDLYGLPLPQMIYDDNANRSNITDEQYNIDIRLVNQPFQGAIKDCREGISELDVSSAPSGYILFRLVHPVDEQITQYSKPVAKGLTAITKNKRE